MPRKVTKIANSSTRVAVFGCVFGFFYCLFFGGFGGGFGGGFEAHAQSLDTEFLPEEEENLPASDWDPQEAEAEYWARYRREQQAVENLQRSDNQIFNTPPWGLPDPFAMFSRYRFGVVRYRRRGLDARYQQTFLGAVSLSDNLSGYPDWTMISLTRRSGLTLTQLPAKDSYSTRATGKEIYGLLRGQNRNFRFGADARYAGTLGRGGGSGRGGGWDFRAALTGTTADDGSIEGLRADGIGGTAAATKTWPGGMSLTVFAAGNYFDRGARSAVTREAIDLTGNELYNPTWGWQDGKIRNSRMNSVRQFFTSARFEMALPGERKLSAEVAFRHSRDGRTRLAWYDATSPLPDYYRKMPSWFASGATRETIARAWQSGEGRTVQVDWEALYRSNDLAADGRANYIVEERVERSNDIHLDINIGRQPAKGLQVAYGLRVRHDRSRFFKRVDDMLGAEWVPNVDQYVTDDLDSEVATETRAENDLRNPGRRVYEGDRFGYDYAVTRTRPGVYGTVDWRTARHGLVIAGELNYTSMRRRGFYEKALFAGKGPSGSFGRSRAVGFTTVSLAVDGWWRFSVWHTLAVSALVSSEPPDAADVFLSPTQNNFLTPENRVMGLYKADMSWIFTTKSFDMRVAGFVGATTGEGYVRQYYDDLAGTFADMAMRGVDKLFFGLELGTETRITPWLTMTLAGSAGSYRYNSEPRATIIEDETGEVIASDVVCYISGMKTAEPQIVAAAELMYHDRKYWRASVSCEYFGARYVDINPLYRSSRTVGINAAPEIMRTFTDQKRLPDAFTLGLSLSKGFVLKRGYLRVAASVRNVLSSKIIYSAYEQMRIMRRGSGINQTFVPFPVKYLYAYPVTWNLTVSYRI